MLCTQQPPFKILTILQFHVVLVWSGSITSDWISSKRLASSRAFHISGHQKLMTWGMQLYCWRSWSIPLSSICTIMLKKIEIYSLQGYISMRKLKVLFSSSLPSALQHYWAALAPNVLSHWLKSHNHSNDIWHSSLSGGTGITPFCSNQFQNPFVEKKTIKKKKTDFWRILTKLSGSTSLYRRLGNALTYWV